MTRLADVKFVTLLKYAAITSAVGSGGLLITREYLRTKFRKCGYYERTIKIIEENKNVGNLLGRPIKFGNLDLGSNEKFYVTNDKAFMRIFVKGPYDKGYVTSYSLRTPASEETKNDETPAKEPDEGLPNDRWEVMRVELSVSKHKDKRLIVFRKPEADEEFVETFHDFIHEETEVNERVN